MKTKAKLILASAVFVAALMLLVPLAQTDMSGGGGIGNSDSDPIVLSAGTDDGVKSLSELTTALGSAGTKDKPITVKLGKDLTFNQSDSTPIIKSYTTLDLNGHKITITESGSDNHGKLVVADEAINAKITNGTIIYSGAGESKSTIRVGSIDKATEPSKHSSVELTNLNIISNGYGVSVFGNVNLTVNNLNVLAVSSAISTNGNAANVGSNSCGSTITITGGQYTSTDTAAIYFPGGDNLTVNGGTFTGKTGFDIRSGAVSISGATINVFGKPSEVKSGDGPTSWGMGIAVFNMSPYGQDVKGDPTELNITIANTSINNAVYNTYIGDYHIDTDGKLKTSDLGTHTHSQIHAVTLNDISKTDIVLENGTRSADSAVPLTIDINNHIFANGNAITISDGINNNTSKITYGNDIIFVDNFDLSKFTIFGGSKDNTSVNSSSITMNGGTVAYIYGGGYGTSADKSASVGTASIKITGGKVLATVFGGGLGYATVNETTITISDAAIGRDVVAGGSNNNVTTPVNKVLKATVNISDGTMDNPTISGGVYGGGQSLAYVETSEINVTGGTIRLLCASGSNGITDTTKMNIDGNAKITYLLSVNRGVINNSEINIKSSFTGTIDKLALGALSDWDNSGKNNNQFTGGSTDGAVIESVKLTVECSGLNSSTSEDTQVFLGRGLYSNYGNSPFTYGDNTYYQHYAYSPNATLDKGTKITTPIAANVTVSGNVNVIAYVGNTTNDYDPTTFIIGDENIWTFENGAMITPHDVSNKTTTIQNDGKLIFDGANVGEDGLVLTCGGNIEIKNTTFTKKGLYINGADNVTITGCKFTNISESPILATDPNLYSNAIYLLNCKGNITISDVESGVSKDDENTTSAAGVSKPMRGIYLDYCGASENSSLLIQNNTISDVDFNTIQITNASFSKINISNNTISNWDDDADDGNVEDPLYEKGRAIRITATSKTEIELLDNTFLKSYIIGKTYDEFIIKITDDSGGLISGTSVSGTATISFIADSTTTDPYAEGLAILCKNFFVNSYASDDTKINITVGNNDKNNKTHFTTKGLYINGANNVTIQNCEFTNITEMIDSSPDAIQLVDCTGTITITDNKISKVAVDKSDKPDMGMGINIFCRTVECSNIKILDNVIEDIAHNAIIVQSNADIIVASILIEDNILSNWDSDSTNNSEANSSDLYYGGRAIRLATGVGNVNSSIVSENTFIKNYSDNSKYDDGNILKATVYSPDFKDNVLRLTGITDYSGDKLFIFGDNEKRFLVTFNANGGYFLDDSSNTNLYSLFVASENNSATVTEPDKDLINRSGSYSFNGWYDAATGGNKWDFATDTISSDKTLYANWTYTGGSGGVPVTPPTDEPTIVPDNGNVTVPPIDDKKADELIHKAVSSGSDSVSIIDTSNVDGKYTEVTVSKSDLETISKKIENNNNINSVSIETSEGDIILEKEVLNSILETTDADSVSFEIEDAKDKLTDAQKEAVGDRPVYDINITAGNENITSFNGKTITISLPYTLKAGEDPENIVVYYVKEDGSLEKVNCTYKDGKVIFETDHLSKYVIGYEESDKPVTPDTPDDKKDDNNTIYYAVAAVIVILIIIALAYYFMKKKQ